MTAFPDFGQKLDFKGPSLSANNKVKSAISQKLTVDLILYTYKKYIQTAGQSKTDKSLFSHKFKGFFTSHVFYIKSENKHVRQTFF